MYKRAAHYVINVRTPCHIHLISNNWKHFHAMLQELHAWFFAPERTYRILVIQYIAHGMHERLGTHALINVTSAPQISNRSMFCYSPIVCCYVNLVSPQSKLKPYRENRRVFLTLCSACKMCTRQLTPRRHKE